MHDQRIGVLGKIDELRIAAILVRAEHDGLALGLDPVGERRQVGVRDALRAHNQPVALEHFRGLGLADIDDARLDARALDAGLLCSERRAQHLERAGLLIEQPREKDLEIRRDRVA